MSANVKRRVITRDRRQVIVRPKHKEKVKAGREKVARMISVDQEDFDEYMIDDIPNLPTGFNIRSSHEDFTEMELQQIKLENDKFRGDPLLFTKRELGIPNSWFAKDSIGISDLPPEGYEYKPYKTLPLWSKQKEILRALVEHRRVAVKSGHGVGKTFIAAIAALYLAYVWRALGVTTAPTGRQVKRLLWGEIAAQYNHANQYQMKMNKPGLGGRLLQTSLELGDKWYVLGFSTDKKDFNVPGFHEETVFAIIDEACGVEPIVYDLLETILNSENAFVLYIGNPSDPNTEFKKCFDPGSDFYPITISCYDSPNVKYQRTIYPKLVHHTWPERMKGKWGDNSILFKSRVLAEFPETSTDALIPFSRIQAALDRILEEDKVISIGVDVARDGGDRIIIGKRFASGAHRIVHNLDKARVTETAGRVVRLIEDCSIPVFNHKGKQEKMHRPVANVDDIGVGGGVTDLLIEQEYEANGINVGESAKGLYLDKEERVRFFNKRAYYYWKLRKAFMEGKIDIDDDEIGEELMHIKTKVRSDGSLMIIPKEKIREMLGRSPDKAEELMLAFAEEEFKPGKTVTTVT